MSSLMKDTVPETVNGIRIARKVRKLDNVLRITNRLRGYPQLPSL
jgi:hypothetical protein